MDSIKLPFYLKLCLNLISIGLIITALSIGKGVILPILFAILLATLLLPVQSFLRRKKFPKPLSILFPIVTTVLIITAVLYFLTHQIINFFDDAETLNARFVEFGTMAQAWIEDTLGLSPGKQNAYVNDGLKKAQTMIPKVVQSSFLSLTELLTFAVLIPVYTFLILYYKDTIKQFLVQSFKTGNSKKVEEILYDCTTVARAYVLGLSIETVLVFSLNVVGFLLLGIKYAVFLALLAALLNNIPYVGILVANVLAILITLISSDTPTDALWVGVILGVVQFLDNNFGMPLIVGNKVKINALVTIVGIILGGAICGVPGMFLAIPGLAVMKIVFERIDGTRPWAGLLSDEVSEKEKKVK